MFGSTSALLQLVGHGNAQGIELGVATRKKVGIWETMRSSRSGRLVMNRSPRDSVGLAGR